MTQAFDLQLANIWNDIHPDSQISPEQFWDVCRELSSQEILQPNRSAVSAISIGPFHIATKLGKDKLELLDFFLERVFPALITQTASFSFEQVYPLYILPAIKVLLHFVKNIFIIKDVSMWEILIYIKRANEQNDFPTIAEIENHFVEISRRGNIADTVHNLFNLKNITGTGVPVVSIDENGGLHSLV